MSVFSDAISDVRVRAGCDLHVLMVEDNRTYSAWLSGLLRHEGNQRGRQMQVIETESLADAKKMLASRRIDVVLLDLNLPDSNGLETVSAIALSSPNLPIVVVSATEDEDIAIKALSRGAQEYIFKGREREGSVFRTMCRSMERKNVELQLALAQQQAMHSERMAAIGMMASGVAHEYNNIGAVILGNVELLLGSGKLPSELIPRAERIRDAADRASAVTQGLLAYVRGFRETEQTVVMQDMIRSTVSLAESTLRRYQVEASSVLPSDPLAVRGNASILGQVLLNLIINACHSMEGLPVRKLHIAIKRDESGIGMVMSVRDVGRGIAAEDRERIFVPFFTTKHVSGSTTSGTGLGLAVCEAFVRQLGGTIQVESELGQGATFHIWLPLAMSAPSLGPVEVLPPIALEVEGQRALIIDDEEGVREFFDVALQDLGMTTTTSDALAKVLPLNPATLPDVVLTDWQLRGESGRTMVEHLLTLPLEHRPAILVSSGNLSADDQAWLEGIPGVSFIWKPVSLRDLQELVRKALARRRSG